MKILVSALESSANLHLKELLKHLDLYTICGIFDKQDGFNPLYRSSEFGIIGFLDVIFVYKKAKKAIKEMSVLAKSVDVVLLIDSPAFNIPLAKEIKKISPHIKIIYYILPQVWAWKKNRVAVLESCADKLLSILPFEKNYWNKSIYVGNPICDEIKTVKTEILNNNITAFLPGSRKGEIKKLMPIYKEVAKELNGEKILVIPSFFPDEDIEKIYGNLDLFTISRDTQTSFLKASKAVVCSGTATLEASYIGTPFILVYKAKKLDFIIGRFFIKLPFVGLANLIFYFDNKKPIHNELLQDEVTTKNILKELNLLDENKFMEFSVNLRSCLQSEDGSKKVSEIIMECCK